MLNPKKPLKLRNNTKYFNPETSRAYVTFGSPDTYQSRQIKIEGYETRLYWQYRYCDAHSGQTFFYTLTYNDNAIPKPYGFNCFDYEDLRDLLTGGFRKMLLRKYGTIFKYFIGAELGDGKGERGMHNNPHYHVLFFLEPANNPRYPYVKISPEDFRHLIRTYWQGFDEDTDGFHPYEQAKYGICKEGSENLGLVIDYRAEGYCAKYVCKDVDLKKKERDVEKKIRFQARKSYKHSLESYMDFFDYVINDYYNIPRNPKKTEWTFSPVELVDRLNPKFFASRPCMPFVLDPIDKVNATVSIINLYELREDYFRFVRNQVDERIRLGMNEYRNRYCNKCRISHGVGDYALDFITDYSNPTVQVPSKKGFKNRPLSMYYYRKLFTRVIVDKVGSPIRVINELGIKYKVGRLQAQLDKKAEAARNCLGLVVENPDLFEKIRQSDVNTQVRYHYDNFFKRLTYLLEDNNNNIEEIFTRYAEFKLVYEDRFFPFDDYGDYSNAHFPDIDPVNDYERFLQPSIYSVSRNDIRLYHFLETGGKGYLSYYQHPYFLRYIGIFGVLDTVADYLFVQGDNVRQKDAEERAAVKRFHDREKIKEFYRTFQRW